MPTTFIQKEPYHIKERKDFFAACKKLELEKISFIVKRNSFSYSNHVINEEQVDQALEMVNSSKKAKKIKLPIIEYLHAIKIQKHFIEACEDHDLELVKQLLGDSTVNMHIHFSQIKLGFEKSYDYGNPLVDSDTRFTNDMYMYLGDLLDHYSQTFEESIRNNNFEHFKTHLPDLVERHSETENQKHDMSVYLQKLLNTACREGKVEFIDFLHTSKDLKLKPQLEFVAPNKPEFNAFHIACENNQIEVINYLINHSIKKPGEKTIHSFKDKKQYSEEVQEYLSHHSNYCTDTNAFFHRTKSILMDDFESVSQKIIEISQESQFKEFSQDSITLLTDLFIEACTKGNFKMVEFLTTSPLLPLHANFNFDNIYKTDTGFNYACQNGHLDIIKFLSQNNDQKEQSIVASHGLENACKNGHIEVIPYLTEKYLPWAYNLANDLLKVACENGQLDTIKFLHKEYNYFQKYLSLYDYRTDKSNFLCDTLKSKKSPETIIAIIDYLINNLLDIDPKKMSVPLNYKNILIDALKSEQLPIVDFLFKNNTLKNNFVLEGNEREIIEVLCTNNDNNLAMIEYVLCECRLKKTSNVNEFFLKTKKELEIVPNSNEMKRVMENVTYTDKLFAVVELNEKMKHIPVNDVSYKKKKI